MRRIALVVGLLAACGREQRQRIEPAPQPTEPHALPVFAPLPPTSSTNATPQTLVPDGRPILFLFSASWCPTCSASLLTEISIAAEYGDRFQVGVGLVENSDEDFAKWPMAKVLGNTTVWNAKSVKAYAAQCDASAIPLACLVDHGRVVFRGPAVSARHVLDGYRTLSQTLAAALDNHVSVIAKLGLGGLDRDDAAELVKATHDDPGWQNTLAYQFVSRRESTVEDAAIAIELARDAVASDGGLDYSHLDTYQLALSKANYADEAAQVSWRVLVVCAAVHADCLIEKRRAYLYIYYARERAKPR